MLKDCSEEVFRGDPARIAQYNLYAAGAGAETTVIILVSQAGNPRVGATVNINNGALADQQTDAQGQVSFSSVNLTDSVDLVITDPTLGVLNLPDEAVIVGDTNIIEAVYP